VYQLERDENALIEATLKTTQFKTKHGIQVGMSKRDVINKLTDFVLQTIPQYLMLEDTEVYEYIILRFDGDQVKQIDFVGYID
jgi:hypothetical protein